MKKVFYSIFAIAAFAFNSNAQEETKQQEPVKSETENTESPVSSTTQQTPGINRLSVERISKMKTKELKPKKEVVNEKQLATETPSPAVETESK